MNAPPSDRHHTNANTTATDRWHLNLPHIHNNTNQQELDTDGSGTLTREDFLSEVAMDVGGTATTLRDVFGLFEDDEEEEEEVCEGLW